MLTYESNDVKNYKSMLRNTGALSRLFSENDAPYLVSRSVENIYCVAFGAKNLGRSDCSADAKYKKIGVGIKTFLHENGKTLQKVAEFNKQSNLYRDKTVKEVVLKIAELRNERIRFTKRNYGIDNMIYHCVTRLPGKILVFEESMDEIDIKNITGITSNTNTITFTDGIHEYSFNLTKSTLYKRFILDKYEALYSIDVQILEHPYLELEKLTMTDDDSISLKVAVLDKPSKRVATLDTVVEEGEGGDYVPLGDLCAGDYVILPLFSDRGNKRHVPERSGLNQWNAKGRLRDPNEIYIPIPKWIHNVYPEFFPARDAIFRLVLPNGRVLDTKVCQDGSKALMSNPNKALGEWLLRDVMNLNEDELLTYEMLEDLNIDSVRLMKVSEQQFIIDFCEIGTYDNFKTEANS